MFILFNLQQHHLRWINWKRVTFQFYLSFHFWWFSFCICFHRMSHSSLSDASSSSLKCPQLHVLLWGLTVSHWKSGFLTVEKFPLMLIYFLKALSKASVWSNSWFLLRGKKKSHTGNNVTMAKMKQNLIIYFEYYPDTNRPQGRYYSVPDTKNTSVKL